jgi:uncharacterized LabA/DUF88 family protein/cold shock CspA family protein
MNTVNNKNLLKIGVFYDGNFINYISDHYAFRHNIKSRLSLKGLEEFTINNISKLEDIDSTYCKIVDSHLYRGRTTARNADERDTLYGERVFDDACMYDGVSTHYLPIKMQNGRIQGKGIDVWLALDAYEITSIKKLDIVVIVTSDTDFKPLIKKLHSLGTKTLLLSWNLQWDMDGEIHTTKTSKDLTDSVTWFIDVADHIENDSNVAKLIFVPRGEKENNTPRYSYTSNQDNKFWSTKNYTLKPNWPNENNHNDEVEYDPSARLESEVCSLKNGFGFIAYPPNNLFFHSKDMAEGYDFFELQEGDAVEFQIHTKPDGNLVAKHIKILYSGDNLENNSTDYTSY